MKNKVKKCKHVMWQINGEWSCMKCGEKQDTNQPPHPANNDYAVKVIQEEMTELQASHISSDTLTYGQLFKKLNKLLEKLKS